MNNTFYIIRHAETEVNNDLPVSKWTLNIKGVIQSEKLASDKTFKKVNVLIASDEKKAIQTAKPIAKRLGLTIDKVKAFRELNRDKSGFLEPKTWNFCVKYAMKNPDKSKSDWELASNALQRFSDKIDELDLAYNKRKIIIVTHGIVANLYFAQLKGKLHQAYERMMKTDFCDYGIIKNGQIVQDILK